MAVAILASTALLLFALLLPFGRSSEIGILLCMIACLIGLPILRQHWRSQRSAFAGLALVILAIVASALDSADRADTLKTAGNFLRYGFLIGATLLLSTAWRQHITRGVGFIVLLWLADALCQSSLGYGLRGLSHSDRLSGIFGADNLKLGPILSLLAPFALFLPEAIEKSKQRWLARALIWLACAAVLLMAGSRAGWVNFAVVSMLWAVHLARVNWRLLFGLGLALASFAALTTVLLMKYDERFQARMTRTLALFDGNTADYALAGRMPIWQSSIRMIGAHPINGVGARAFTRAYPQYAANNDPWMHPDGTAGAAHAHQWLLETLSETGVIGFAAWLMTLVLLLKHWRNLDADQRLAYTPWIIALITMMNPFNTHLALYSSYYGSVFWWLYAMCISLPKRSDAATIK
jgi:O-antigen ligase